MIWGRYSRLGLAAATAAAAADQIQKTWTVDLFAADPHARFEIFPFLDLVLVWNRGISYGLLKQNTAAGRWVLVAFSIAAALALVLWLARLQSRVAAVGAGLIVGGALGNAIDRMVYGAVADFFSFHAHGFYWYVFNLADAAIVAGVAALLYDSVLTSHKRAGNQI